MNNLKNELEKIKADIIDFTKKFIQIKSFTGKEAEATKLVANKMKELGYDEVTIDSYGSVLGRIGSGKTKILYDAHIDVVEAKDEAEWKYPPFAAEIHDNIIYGRGTVDTKSSVISMIYAGYLVKKLNLCKDKTIYISASVMEEDFDGELLYRAIKENNLELDYVIIGEPSNLQIALGHRGRSMYKITTLGVSAHGSAPEKGDNAIYKMAKILERIENKQKEFDKLEGEKGSIVVSNIEARTASLNAVPDMCTIYIDRRLAMGETEDKVNKEMASFIEGIDAKYEIYIAEGVSQTGKEVTLRTFMPAWEISKENYLTQVAIKSYEECFNAEAPLFKWPFSTNGFATNGEIKVPTIGFGPGNLKLAHMKDERCHIDDLYKTIIFYSSVAKNC
ncbi:YgeY family selenium metabolism-linked hydrolase [Fusobacterium sp.]|uniref:YgeY family selenium metabolism-linked hydrolase n=1 Tax=Fusobacterium sp. TaxID=68766 RepID=UPI0026368F43|nr:YgeY family selenium metabolism-linked hydrolase [Fusobacterium sp.]